jgi:hypothetical protein
MGTTASGLPYPESTDPPDVPKDMKALADAVERGLDALKSKIDTDVAANTAALQALGVSQVLMGQVQDGVVTVPKKYTVTFAKRFKSAPKVFAQDYEQQWHLINISKVSATGFEMYIDNAAKPGAGTQLITRVWWVALGAKA